MEFVMFTGVLPEYLAFSERKASYGEPTAKTDF